MLPLLDENASLHEILMQDQWWRDAHGRWVRLTDIDARYATNIVRWLLRNGDAIKEELEWSLVRDPIQPQGDVANDVWEAEFDQLLRQTPTQWLAEQPLVRALWAIVHPDKAPRLRAWLQLRLDSLDVAEEWARGEATQDWGGS